jgi:small subunit ribosomal protein S6
MVRQYETTFLIDSHLPNEQIEACITKYTQLIEKNTGKIKLIERWGKRRMAYEIAKKQYGFYVYIRFEGEGTLCQELKRVFNLDDAVIRFLTVVLPKAALKDEAQRAVQAQAADAAKTAVPAAPVTEAPAKSIAEGEEA